MREPTLREPLTWLNVTRLAHRAMPVLWRSQALIEWDHYRTKVTSLSRLASFFPAMQRAHFDIVFHDHLCDHVPRLPNRALRGSREVTGRLRPRAAGAAYTSQRRRLTHDAWLEPGVVVLVPVLIRGTRMHLRHSARPLSNRHSSGVSSVVANSTARPGGSSPRHKAETGLIRPRTPRVEVRSESV